jgi:hypothetical protein
MNLPNFPLYNTLNKSDFKELEEDEKDQLVEKFKLMSDEKHEIVYAIIKAFYMEEHQQYISTNNELPYNGKSLKNRLKFDLDHIPSKLQYILKIFLEIE